MGNAELVKRVYVSELKEYFNLQQVSGNEESLHRWIIAPDVNRPGLELAGYRDSDDLKRVVIIGNKECKYLEQVDEETQRERFQIITDSYTPCIIMTGKNKASKVLLEVAQAKNFPVFETNWKSYMTTQNVVAFLSRRLAPETDLYGVMMEINGIGVLLTGNSAIGKSELALELIRRGHTFIADDRVEVARIQNDLICSPSPLLKGMLEIRGIGIIDVNSMFGASATLDSCPLDVVIHLEHFQPENEYRRLSYEEEFIKILELKRPYYKIPVTGGRALGVLIEAAITNYRLTQRGYNSTESFNQRVLQAIEIKNKERGEELW